MARYSFHFVFMPRFPYGCILCHSLSFTSRFRLAFTSNQLRHTCFVYCFQCAINNTLKYETETVCSINTCTHRKAGKMDSNESNDKWPCLYRVIAPLESILINRHINFVSQSSPEMRQFVKQSSATSVCAHVAYRWKRPNGTNSHIWLSDCSHLWL